MKTVNDVNRKLILEDGSEYLGYAFGDSEDKVCEIVFNTSMVGYQEIISDPSYTYQAVVMTYPLIGNYGMMFEDNETMTPTIGALIVHEINDEPSNFRSEKTVDSILKSYKIPGIYGVDTRKINRSIRDLGSRKVLITGVDTTLEQGLEILKNTDIPKDAVSKVSCQEFISCPAAIKETTVNNRPFNVVAIDCGMKQNIVRSLNLRGCNVIRVPWNTSAERIEDFSPDGVFISNGPGDPTDVMETVETIKALKGKYPMFGICLGHQIISLAYGAKTYKLKFGHRGGNHPVRNLENGKIEITSQNHSYAVDDSSIEGTGLEITHINILDNTVEGVKCEKDRLFSVQYHPESAPGPQDSSYLFDKFVETMKKERGLRNA